jgi:hypothetical protein
MVDSHLQKISWLNNSILFLKTKPELFFLSLGVFSLGFSKTFWLIYPDFFLGKFSYLMTYNLTISIVLIAFGSIIGILKIRKKIKIDFLYTIFALIILAICIRNGNPNLFNIVNTILFAIYLSNTKKSDLVYLLKSLLFGTLAQVLLGIVQCITQSSSSIATLKFLGEPNLNIESTKGISHIDGIVRSYGTTNHPNFLAGMIFTSLLFINIFNHKIKSGILSLGLLSTLSISGIASTILVFIKQKKLVSIFGILIISIGIYKLNATNYTGLTDRIQEIQNFNLNFNSVSDLILGTKNYISNNPNFKLLPWEITPIHNHILEIFRQFGLVGILFAVAVGKRIWNNSRFAFIALIPVILLDHYFLSLANGLILFCLIYFGIEKIGISSQEV